MTPELKSLIKIFFEENELAIKAAHSIRDGHDILITVIEADATTSTFTFTKEGEKNFLKESESNSPDVTFTVPLAAIREIVETKFESVGQAGLRIFEKMLSDDPAQKVKAKLSVGLFSLIAGGYLGVLTSGGVEVARFLASKGLSNISKIKDAILRMKN